MVDGFYSPAPGTRLSSEGCFRPQRRSKNGRKCWPNWPLTTVRALLRISGKSKSAMTMKAVVLAVAATTCVSAAAAGGYAALHSRRAAQAAPAVDTPQAVATTEQLVGPAPAPAGSSATAAPASPGTPVSVAGKDRPRQTAGDHPRPSVGDTTAPTSGATSPATSATTVASQPVTTPTVSDPTPPVSDPATSAAPAPPAPTRPRMEEVTLKEDAVIGITLDTMVSTETSKVEDRVTAQVTRDVAVEGRTAIPAKSRLEGVVTLVERGGKFSNRARLGIRFETLILADNTRVPLHTDTILREGESPAGPATSKIGAGVVGGAILGAVIGGKKGAAIGSTVGAAGGTAVVMSGAPSLAQISGGTPLTVRLTQPVTLLIERDPY